MRRPSPVELAEAELERLVIELEEEFPQFEIVNKDDSILMKFIDLFLWICTFGGMAAFMDTYVTTIGTTMYVPDDWAARPAYSKATLLRHERVHMRQSKKYGRFFFILFYLCFPLPAGFAWGRMRIERAAYEESMRARAEYDGIEVLYQLKHTMVRKFTGPDYLWMWPFRSRMERWYDGVVADLERELDAKEG